MDWLIYGSIGAVALVLLLALYCGVVIYLLGGIKW